MGTCREESADRTPPRWPAPLHYRRIPVTPMEPPAVQYLPIMVCCAPDMDGLPLTPDVPMVNGRQQRTTALCA